MAETSDFESLYDEVVRQVERLTAERDYLAERCDALEAQQSALLAAVERGDADTARLRGLERFACVIVTRLSDGYEERFERDSDEDEPFLDWLDFVIATTEANQADADAARAHPPIQETDADA